MANMTPLDEREAFLRAIFDSPEDDLPRLIFADWLDDHGEPDWAAFIRADCRWAAQKKSLGQAGDEPDPELNAERLTLLRRAYPQDAIFDTFRTDRGFPVCLSIIVSAQELGDPAAFRERALLQDPEWYGCPSFTLLGGPIVSSKPIQTLLTSPVTQRVVELNLSGSIIDSEPFEFSLSHDVDPAPDEFELTLREFEYRPAITVQAVEALVNAREARRFVSLDLRNNDLDNDAARAIIRSTNLIRLRTLWLFEGNQLRGKTWAQLQERFGEGVVQ
jgi:uncharacterized protein (TIGR02996 family)